ncbi:DUF2200 domain-containing protein [Vagococcus hydrophili]|uniref:DUF2200 domain-containing protein n=1 Tax=Vagococcus hydrophili TaxID=2714947 RepID=A0A6G8AVW2_9ENTE|nr:DUF2200 domain-containing protein [Vagococcus hydrophili]QIL49109.1 DUF2200 domain-containing protein [Vagococcus hydrophili]
MNNEKVFEMTFSSVYPLYVKKIEKKGRTEEELIQVITWLTGYSSEGIQQQIQRDVSFRVFFEEAPEMNLNTQLIKGVICGYRVEEIEDKLMQKIRYLDKLVDELAKGKKMEKILRS